MSPSGTDLPSSPPHRLAPWRATGVLLLLLGLGLAILFFVQGAPRRMSVDVLELLPRDQLDPTIRLARQVASGRLGRTMLLALSDSQNLGKAPVEAAAKFAAGLSEEPSFSGAFAGLGAGDKDRVAKWFFSRRLSLRMPFWLDAMTDRWHKEKGQDSLPDTAWLAAAAAADLQEFQESPDAAAYQEPLRADPLLLMPGLVSIFGDDEKTSASEAIGGSLTAAGEDGTRYALIYAEIKAPPLEEAGQQPVFDAIKRQLAAAHGLSGQKLSLRYSGVNRFAAESRSRASREVDLLTTISLVASCALLYAAFRRIAAFAYLLLPILTATVWSLVICFTVFEKVHVVAIIFTTVLVGVALDYGVYTLTHAQKAGRGMAEALKDIRLPLVSGCLTSVGGFVFMTLTNLPLLQQMGLAVALGLVFSLALDFLYLPWVPAVHLDYRAERRPRHFALDGWRFPLLALGLLAASGALVYAAHIHWDDDVRTLQTMPPELQAEEAAMKKLFGVSRSDRLVITFGKDIDEALANQDKLNTVLTARSQAPGQRYFNLTRLLPTAARSARARDYFLQHSDFPAKLRAALDANFNADLFAPFWSDWDAWTKTFADPKQASPSVAPVLAELRTVLPLPLQNLWSDEQAGSNWAATRVSPALFAQIPAEALAAPNAAIDQVNTLNGALARYRVAATQRGGIGLAVIAVCVTLVYGWRRGGFMLVTPAIAILLTVAVLGFLGQSLGLLHVVALLLGFCLASDYSIFLASPGELPNSTRRAIRLAASTALLSFIVLSFSQINALRDICLTVSLVIGFVLVFCEASYQLFVRVADGGVAEE